VPANHAPARPPRLRDAVPDDVPQILRLIQELAEYERAPDAVEATEQHLRTALFPSDPASARSHAIVAEVDGADGRPQVVGMAVWYVTFSTWLGRHGLWLEDLFVRPQHRGSGLGKALLARLAALCVERGYGRLEWWVLNWNEPSIGFYRSLGAVAQDEWTVFRLDGAALARLAERSDQTSHPDE
jgi:GNAT superfamily N-acetyltransferase